jgi:hypothetical protein
MPELFRQRFAAGVQVHTNDLFGADHPQPLDHIQPNPAEPEHHGPGAGLHLGGVHHRTDPGGDAAADVADLVERRVWPDFCQRDLRQHGEVGEGRGAHIMGERFAAAGKAAGPVGHQPPSPG